MGRVTDDERREVARRLRESAENGEVLRDVFLEEILAGDTGLWFAEDIEIDTLLYHLADLIEPSCDRETLLDVADECDMMRDDGLPIGSYEIYRIARRIREACGVSDDA